jgi:hypothetical protein
LILAHTEYVTGSEFGDPVAAFVNHLLALLLFPIPYFQAGRWVAGIVALVLWFLFWGLVFRAWKYRDRFRRHR